MEVLYTIGVMYGLVSAFMTLVYTSEIFMEGLFNDGFQVHHVLFFPSVLAAFVLIVVILILGYLSYLLISLFTFRL